MTTDNFSLERFPIVTCPGCKVKMDVSRPATSPLLGGLSTVHYHCLECQTTTTREIKRDHEHNSA